MICLVPCLQECEGSFPVNHQCTSACRQVSAVPWPAVYTFMSSSAAVCAPIGYHGVPTIATIHLHTCNNERAITGMKSFSHRIWSHSTNRRVRLYKSKDPSTYTSHYFLKVVDNTELTNWRAVWALSFRRMTQLWTRPMVTPCLHYSTVSIWLLKKPDLTT